MGRALRLGPLSLTLALCAGLTGSAWAVIAPESASGVAAMKFRHPDLAIEEILDAPAELPSHAKGVAAGHLAALGARAGDARVDRRGGGWATLILSRPVVPGSGRGNGLSWSDVGTPAPRGRAELEAAAWRGFDRFVREHAVELRVAPGELGATRRVTSHQGGDVVQIYSGRAVDGIPVRGSYVTAVVNHGNLVLFGAHRWGRVAVSTHPALSAEQAAAAVGDFAAPFDVSGAWGRPELAILPMAAGRGADVALGKGYAHRLAWVVRPSFAGDRGTWEALVDAHSGQVLAFQDLNRYGEVEGGVLPVSNDGVSPDGVEQPDWPMPFSAVSTSGGSVTTDGGGNFTASGTVSTNLSGPFVRMNDNCGSISLSGSGSGVLDFGTSGGTDCTTPGFGGAGNTHASRSGFYELNRIAEMARGQLPANSWLGQQLTSNMNINSTCNAFWNGSTVNFYRSGGGCSNTGEIAGIFDHEWGHGMDDNDANPSISSPGEGIADVYAALRLDDSCIGRNFRPGIQCGGYGDPCTDCTGVRDIDWANRESGAPHTFTWANATCGGGVHCRGYVYSEAVWDLWKRDLPAVYGMGDDTAHEVAARLTYVGGGNVGTWYSGSPPFGGCGSTSGYLNYLAADDDNGNISDGTPHMQAIFDAFNRHEIACDTPAVQDAGCSGTPSSAPSVTATPLDKGVDLSWGAVAGTSVYEVYRTDGVFACDFGKVKIAETTGTSFTDGGLKNGHAYSYVVIPKGPADGCFGPASACSTATPAAGPNLEVDTGSAVLSTSGGDGDEFLDNCETGTLTFDVDNTGLGSLTNARIVSASSPSHPSITVLTSFPAALSPSTIPEGGSAVGSFDFLADGLSFDDTVVFDVEVTADEMTVTKTASLTVGGAESDFVFYASRTFDFETGTEGWQVLEGTFNRTSSGGGAGGSAWYEASSANLDDQCDAIRSPVMSLASSSTLSLANQFDIEPQFTNGVWYDRANVGVRPVGGARTPVSPDGGRLYNASGSQGTCGTAGQPGWADQALSWGTSSWSASALGSAGWAGQQVQLEIRYGTDFSINGFGFHFDQVTVTDVDFQEGDQQSDVCDASCTIDADCDDGLFCNGAETCDAGTCAAGTPPACGDGVGCTVDSCNEATDSCDNVPDDGACDNGLFCDGAETCSATLDCQPGTPVDCDDGVSCTADSCDEGADGCDNVPNDAVCDNGLFCDGAETCDPFDDCQAGSDPCSGGTCDEETDTCEGGCGDGICEAGEDCNTCPADCPTFPLPGAACGNGVCEAGDGEDCLSCPADCNGIQNGNPNGRFCCGDGDGQNPIGCENTLCSSGDFSCTDVPQPGGSTCCGDAVCEAPEDGTSCELDCGAPAVCGDDVAEGDEVCDGTDLGGATCADFGCSGGTLACAGDCSGYDTSGCTGCASCGNGICELGESCTTCSSDCDGKSNGPPSGRFCCGDGTPQPPEGDGSICDGNF